jgi:hypothetical protein
MARTRFTGRNGSLSQAGFRSFRALGTYHKACCMGGGLIGIEWLKCCVPAISCHFPGKKSFDGVLPLAKAK